MSLVTGVLAAVEVVQVALAGAGQDSEAGAGAVAVAIYVPQVSVPKHPSVSQYHTYARKGASKGEKRREEKNVRKKTANSARIGTSRANVAVEGGGKTGASARGAENKDLAGILPVGAGADVDLD